MDVVVELPDSLGLNPLFVRAVFAGILICRSIFYQVLDRLNPLFVRGGLCGSDTTLTLNDPGNLMSQSLIRQGGLCGGLNKTKPCKLSMQCTSQSLIRQGGVCGANRRNQVE